MGAGGAPLGGGEPAMAGPPPLRTSVAASAPPRSASFAAAPMPLAENSSGFIGGPGSWFFIGVPSDLYGVVPVAGPAVVAWAPMPMPPPALAVASGEAALGRRPL